MSELKDIKAVVDVLSRVPAKSLRIVELLNQIPIKNGELDIITLEKLGSEVEEAKKEAEAYKHETEQAVRAITEMHDRENYPALFGGQDD
jgi:hypothetical protein